MNYIRLLPLMLFPYAYLILLLMFYKMPDSFLSSEALPITVIVYLALTLISTVFGAFYAAISKLSPRKAATLNLVVKAVQIPAYIFHFILGMLGTVASIWRIGLIMFAIAIDLVTIALTGIHAVGCTVKNCKSGAISKCAAAFMSIGSFIYCIDLIAAIVLRVMSNKYKDDYIKPQIGEKNAVQTDQSI